VNKKCCLIDEVLRTKTPCAKALERLKNKGVRGEKLNQTICPWYIDSPFYFYCFWLYLYDEKNRGEHQLTEIAKLLKTSVNNIKLIENNALSKIREQLTHLTDQNF